VDAAVATKDGSAQADGSGAAKDASAQADGAAGDGGHTVPGLTVTTLTANQSGRDGGDLLITVSGSDANESAFALDVRLQDESGNPVPAFPDSQGVLSLPERIVMFDNASAVGMKTFTRTVTLAGFMGALPAIATVKGSLIDSLGSSTSVNANVTVQSMKQLGQPCDIHVIANRCAAGLACTGSPATCAQGTSPQISEFVYQRSALGPFIRLRGADPADDVMSIHLEFLNGSGGSVQVVMDDTGDIQSSVDIDVTGTSVLGSFAFIDEAAAGFDQTVLELAATATGSSTGAGKRVIAVLENQTTAATGHACDLLGFTTCVAGDVCSAQQADGGVSSATECVTKSSAQSGAAAVASMLNPAVGHVFAAGYTQATNLWGDAPSGCESTPTPGAPESIVLLHLAASAASVTISADNPETNFYPALFVLPNTGASVGSPALGCTSSWPPLLTLTDLAAGDYTIVVESRTTGGGQFGLSIQ
jgi:hypothetical protein